MALLSEATEVLYGGAAGGGKSFLMRAAAILWCCAIPGLQVYIFRRISDDLVKNHMEGPKGFRALLAAMAADGWASIVEDEIRFWNGAKIYLCHCKDAKDVYKYQGAEIHVLLIDELTHFTEQMYRFLRNRVRMVGITLPAEYVGKFPRILCGSNPGNIGHQFVKMGFIDAVGDSMVIRQMPATEGGMRRQYIPAKLNDNPSMAEDDPGYEDRLSGLGSVALVAAMRDGDWDVVEGAFFDNWSSARHVVRPFEIPKAWPRIRAGDWGSAKPFSFGWYALVTDTYRTEGGIILPRGCMVKYREWYGIKESNGSFEANTGLKMTAEDVGRGIVFRDGKEEIDDAVLDPATFAENGGKSIAERMQDEGAWFREADNTRVAGKGALSGWDQVRARLNGDGDGNPMLVFFSTCTHSIRTIPALQHDPLRPEDIDTDGEDHAADETRYACNSRPWVREAKPETQTKPKDRYSRNREGGSWRTA